MMVYITRKGMNQKPSAITRHHAYSSWAAMKQGCRDPRSTAWKTMGGRGCTYPERWNDFNTFITEMGNPPEGYTLARRDISKSFSLENCVWAPKHRHHIKYKLNEDHILPAALRGDMEQTPAQYIVMYRPQSGQTKGGVAGPYPTKDRAERAAMAYLDEGTYTVLTITPLAVNNTKV